MRCWQVRCWWGMAGRPRPGGCRGCLLGLRETAPGEPQVDVVQGGPGGGDPVHPDPRMFQGGEQGGDRRGSVIRPGAQPQASHVDLAHRRDLAQDRGELARVPGGSQADLDRVPAQPALELIRGAGRSLPSPVHNGQPAGQPVGFLQVVRGEQDGEALASGQPGDLRPHRGPGFRVQAGGGLVEEQHLRPVDQPHGHVEPAPHATGVGADHAGRGAAQFEPVQQLAGPAAEFPAAQPLDAPGQQQVLPSGGGRVGARALRDHADGPADLRRLAAHLKAGHGGRARVGPGQGGEDLDGGGLAGPVRPEQAEDGPGRDGETEPVQRPDILGVDLDKLAGLDGERACLRGGDRAGPPRLDTHAEFSSVLGRLGITGPAGRQRVSWSCVNPIGSRSRGTGCGSTAPGQVFPHLAGGRLAFSVSSAAPFPAGAGMGRRFRGLSLRRAGQASRLVELGSQVCGEFPGPGPVVPLLHEGE